MTGRTLVYDGGGLWAQDAAGGQFSGWGGGCPLCAFGAPAVVPLALVWVSDAWLVDSLCLPPPLRLLSQAWHWGDQAPASLFFFYFLYT